MKPRKKKMKTRLHQADISQLRRVQKARADLVKMGLVEDSGVRRHGRIVWRVTPRCIELTQQNPDLLEGPLERGPEDTD